MKQITKGMHAYILRIRGGAPQVRSVRVVGVGERTTTVEDCESGERTVLSPLCLYDNSLDAEIAMRKLMIP